MAGVEMGNFGGPTFLRMFVNEITGQKMESVNPKLSQSVENKGEGRLFQEMEDAI